MTKILVLVFFLLTYVLIIALPKLKVWVTLGSAVLITTVCMASGYMNFMQLLTAIDYNVILMLVGVMLTVGLFADSGMPNKLADKIISKTPSTLFALVLLSLLSGIVSAFVDNVATVLMLAPIGLAVAKKMNVSPIPVIVPPVPIPEQNPWIGPPTCSKISTPVTSL